MPHKHLPTGMRVSHPRKVGMVVKALKLGPATVETISKRLRSEFGYKHYPDPRAIANYLSKYKSLFEIEEKTRNYTIWKLREERGLWRVVD